MAGLRVLLMANPATSRELPRRAKVADFLCGYLDESSRQSCTRLPVLALHPIAEFIVPVGAPTSLALVFDASQLTPIKAIR
jgi:hypothetical protein